ncbi:MAG TPA: polyphosphate kinase 1 [Candidatus Dormibacteraeota bacterium]
MNLAGPGGSRYLNRHLSWLDWNARVLAQAEDPTQKLLERAKFLAIFSGNLDEFFQVRVGALKEQQFAGRPTLSADGMSIGEQLAAVGERARALAQRQQRIFLDDIVPALAAVGIRFSDYSSLDADDRSHLDQVFEERIFPVLTPLAVDPAHPFPYISNLSLNLAVVVAESAGDTMRIARIKVPPSLPRFIVMPDRERFVPLEQVIAAHLSRLFPGMTVVDHTPFRVTRNADYTLDDDDAEDLLAAVTEVLKQRRRAPRVVRLEVERGMTQEVQSLLLRELEIAEEDVCVLDGPLDLSGLWALHRLDRPELKDEPWIPLTQPRLAAVGREGGPDIFDVVGQGDVLIHLPYDSFTTSVEAFLETAAADPDVLAIKQTLYRTDGDSPIVSALIAAAEAGKQVVTLVELTARFDEAANIEWARRLEQSGVHIVYGMVGLKTHAKVSLVVRREARGVRRYCHVGTGNYNAVTARLYEDLGVLTADPEVGEDLTDLFNHLTGYSKQSEFRRLLVAPGTMRSGLLALVRRETRRGAEGRIVLKVNNLVDTEVCDALYEASQAGVEVDLIVRSCCGLRPGVAGLSERIRVRCLLGRYLEHSRIYRFGPDGEADWYIGSADLMARNLDGRVEAVTPVLDPALQARLAEICEIVLADDTLAWELAGDGSWKKLAGAGGLDSQRRLRQLALARAGAGA